MGSKRDLLLESGRMGSVTRGTAQGSIWILRVKISPALTPLPAVLPELTEYGNCMWHWRRWGYQRSTTGGWYGNWGGSGLSKTGTIDIMTDKVLPFPVWDLAPYTIAMQHNK